MRRKNLWITFSFINLCIVALLGVTLRTKFLFPLPAIDYKNFLSAHSHFAFGGWVALSLMILFIDNLLAADAKQSRFYQVILWGIQITSIGMVISFPFKGYAFFSILFSTTFIFFTYAFSWRFLRDLRHVRLHPPVRLLSVAAFACLVISSAGPFYLAYMMSSHTGNAYLYKDSVYCYLHFQYNGFFTFTVLALFFHHILAKVPLLANKIKQFAIALVISLIPSLFLALLWHYNNSFVHLTALIGSILILITLILFFRFSFLRTIYSAYTISFARTLVICAVISFAIKMSLQMLLVIPDIGHLIFGYRPIIIGFMHLVFLALVTFYILAAHIESRNFLLPAPKSFSRTALIVFCSAIFFNEAVLGLQGFEALLRTSSSLFPTLLWLASLALLTGAALILAAWLKEKNRTAFVK
jgi:hypothetical protein